MVNPLTVTELNSAKAMIDRGDLVGFYNYMAANGYGYANLAKGVVECTSDSGGTIALQFVNDAAKAQGVNLTTGQFAKIEVGMAYGYIGTLIELAKQSGNVVFRDINFFEALTVHNDVFPTVGLDPSVWTLYTPSKYLSPDELNTNFADSIAIDANVVSSWGWYSSMLLVELKMTAAGSLAEAMEIRTWMNQTANATLKATRFGENIAACSPGMKDAVIQLQNEAAAKLAANPATQPPDLDTPARNSADYATITGAHTAALTPAGGGIDDIWVLEKGAGNVFEKLEFREAVLTCNPNITDINNVPAGKKIYLPQKFSDGSTTYNYANGTSINISATTETYYMVVPNNDGGQTIYQRVVDVDAGYTVRQVSTNKNGDITFEWEGYQDTLNSEAKPLSVLNEIAPGYQDQQTDTNGDGTFDSRQILYGDGTINDLSSWQDLLDAEYDLTVLGDQGLLDTYFYNDFTDWSSFQLVSFDGATYTHGLNFDFNLSLDPIGAFYETVTPANDLTSSIADKTPVLLGANNAGQTTALLTARDANYFDGKLTGAELTGLNAWIDANEDGHLDAGELQSLTQAGIAQIQSGDYAFYTQGNAVPGAGVATAPVRPNETAGMPSAVSNYRTLRDNDNTYSWTVSGTTYWFDWAANDIKVNVHNKSYVIGTDSADIFDANHFSDWASYIIDSGLLTNFLTGGGDDTFDGSTRSDNIWGGTGKDTLFGNAGDDTIFGEEGNDDLMGEDGNDKLLGGTDDDKLYGEVGDDILWGEEGIDVLVGGEGNDKLLGGIDYDNLYGGLGNDILDGGADNDRLFGNEGSDELFGGDGNDVLQSGDGNDRVLGEAGNDKLFGQTGNDILWGGDGNDILVGFTGSNELKQTLLIGETDNDALYGGAGNDFIWGGLGDDVLYGETGTDELQGGDGNDYLYGGAEDDRLFGQTGNDVLYGGNGDDILLGFTGSNEAKQALIAGETDDDKLYGGAGNDTLFSGLGNDYLDGGAGADFMEGGKGDDIYIVSSVNDTILERADEGYDKVISSTSYMLNTGIEELRLLEGLDIHGTGNALDNNIIGNSRNNILDGVTGADILTGGAGDDTYYVDDAGDQTVELAGEGTDTVQSSISRTLGANLENLILLDFSKPEKGLVEGVATLVYGYPKRNELDYMQGNAVPEYQGTCALTAIANLLTQSDSPTTEADVVQLAIDNNWAVTNPSLPAAQLGGSNYVGQQAILDSYGVRNDLLDRYNEQGVANLIRSGRAVIIAVNAGGLWDDARYTGTGWVNHVVTITGAAYRESDGELLGFYIADSGRSKVSDMTRYVSIEKFREVANVLGAYAIYTIEPLKPWDEDIDGTGNELANTIIGNRGDNVLVGLAGNDVLEGDAGSDTLDGGTGNDTYLFGRGYGQDSAQDYDTTAGNVDTVQLLAGVAPTDVTVGHDASDNLYLKIAGTSDRLTLKNWFSGNDYKVEQVTFADGTVWNATTLASKVSTSTSSGDDYLTGTSGPDLLDGQGGADTFKGGQGNDIYWVDSADDVVAEEASSGTFDTVKSSVSYTIGANVEVLVLTGHGAISGTATNASGAYIYGNDAANILTGGNGADILDGGAGDDTYVANNGDIIIDADGLGKVLLDGTTLAELTYYTGTLNASSDGYFCTKVGGGNKDLLIRNLAGTSSITIMNWNPAVGNGLGISTSGYNDPVVLDLNHDGLINAIASSQSQAYFDFNYDGIGERTGWIAPGDGFLAQDWNQNGVIDDIGELFGSNHSDGFTDLRARLDSNGNGAVESGDADFGTLSVWRDANGDGYSQAGELTSLAQLGITRINLAAVATSLSAADNIITGTSNFTQNGLTYLAADINLAINFSLTNAVRGASGSTSVTGTAGNDVIIGTSSSDLLDGGAGSDRYLFGRNDGWDTISSSDATPGKRDVIRFKSDVDPDGVTLSRVGDDLLLAVVTTSDGPPTAGQGLPTRVTAKGYFVNDGVGPSSIQAIEFEGVASWSFDNVKSRLPGPTANDNILIGYGTADTINGLAGNDTLDGRAGADMLFGGLGNDVYLLGRGSGADLIRDEVVTSQTWVSSGYMVNTGYWEWSDDYEEDVWIDTSYWVDTSHWQTQTAEGTAGDGGQDTLRLGAGIALGDLDLENSGNDLVLGLKDAGGAMAAGSRTDRVTMQAWTDANKRIESIEFASGAKESLANWRIGTAGSDSLTDGAGNGRLFGAAGNDTLDGGTGADFMAGGLGNDTYVVDSTGDTLVEDAGGGTDSVQSSISHTLASQVENLTLTGAAAINGTGNALDNILTGNAGNNVLSGGAGADTLDGDVGNDLYPFARGDGADTIQDVLIVAQNWVSSGYTVNDGYWDWDEYDEYVWFDTSHWVDTSHWQNQTASGGTDAIQFGAGIAADQVWFRHVGNNLEAKVIGTADALTIQDWYLGSNYHVEQFKTADGMTLLDSQVENLVQAMAAFAPPAAGQTTLPAPYQTTLAPVLAANWQQ